MARKRRNLPFDAVGSEFDRGISTAVYLRLSAENSGKDDDGMSMENQKKICMDFLQKHDELELYDVYEDNGRSGTDMDRPALNRMLEDIQNGRVKCVIVKDLSRFSRNYLDAGIYLENVFPFLGVRFISIADNFDSFSMDASGAGFMIAMKNLLNAEYAKDISRKINSTFQERQRKCQILPSFGPYGYVKSKSVAYRYEIDEETAPYVKRIFAWTIEGKRWCEIIRLLDGLDAPTPAARKYELGIWHNEKYAVSRWNTKTLNDLLRNPIYTGSIVYGRMPKNLAEGVLKHRTKPDEWLVFPNMHEALVTQEQFDEVQKILDRKSAEMKRKHKVGQKHRAKIIDRFKGRIFCGDCGGKMRFIKAHDTGTGRCRSRYVCARYLDSQNEKCSRHSIPVEEVEWSALNLIKEQRRCIERYEKARVKVGSQLERSFSTEVRSVTESLKSVAKQQESLFEAYVEKRMDAGEYTAKKAPLNDRYDELEAELKELKRRREDCLSVTDGAGVWIRAVRDSRKQSGLTPELVGSMIESVQIFEDGRMEIRLKYVEERKRLEALYGELIEEGGAYV